MFGPGVSSPFRPARAQWRRVVGGKTFIDCWIDKDRWPVQTLFLDRI